MDAASCTSHLHSTISVAEVLVLQALMIAHEEVADEEIRVLLDKVHLWKRYFGYAKHFR